LPGLELGLSSRWMLAGLIGLLGAAFSGAAYVAVRAAAAKVGVYTIVLYLTGVSTLLSAPFMGLQGAVGFDTRQGAELLAIGLLATAAQLAMTEAYRLARASVVSPMSLLTAAFGALFGWLLFDERLALTQWIGMGVLAASLVVLTRQSHVTR
ncbi:MAG TPA: DMT family transporter, partial [Bdellovibrionota bacterium]|nr:DMT family transporter [Bdellovibrionota bacterium]